MYFKQLSRIAKLAIFLEKRAIESNDIQLALMYANRWFKITDLMAADIRKGGAR